MTLTSISIAVDYFGNLVSNPSAQQIKAASSIHVLAFSSRRELLVVESEEVEGVDGFGIDVWEAVHEKARLICHGHEQDPGDSEDMSMNLEDDSNLENALRGAVQSKMAKEHRWKENVG